MINYKFAKNISKLVMKSLKLYSEDAGTSLPGYIMMRLCPDFLKTESKRIVGTKIFITGTNGKTTTAGFLASILNQTEKSVIHNKKGSNLPQGIATCFLQNKKQEIDYAVFEVDEAWLYSLNKTFKSDYLVITNLFPDQTERYGGVYSLAKKIKKAIELNPNVKLILNADDPHLLVLENKNTIYFGVEKVENNIDELNELSEICTCGQKYKYEKRFYSHLGYFACEKCGKERKQPKYLAEIVLNKENTLVKIKVEEAEYEFKTNILGLCNAYNLLSAATVALEMGVSAEIIQAGFDNYQNLFGRADSFVEKGKKVFVQLIKNPAGTNQAIKLIKNKINSKLLIALNDKFADGRDISWLYNTDFEYFKEYPNEIIFTGTRANEVALRFKHVGLGEENFYIEPNIKKAYKHAINSTRLGENLLVLANFTALKKLKKIVKR